MDKVKTRNKLLLEIEQYERKFATWQDVGKEVVERYRGDKRAKEDMLYGAKQRYNILWSNVQTMLPAVFGRLPKPEVSRRYKDKDPVARVASILLERALEYEVEQYPDYGSSVGEAVLDRLLPGRGVSFVRYEPTLSPVQLSEDEKSEDAETPERIDHEQSPVDYVAWRDFGHNLCRTWEEVYLIWRKVQMTQSEVEKRFGEAAKDLEYDLVPDGEERKDYGDQSATLKRVTVYEVWDKRDKTVTWLTKGHLEALDMQSDPLKLECFFPCPKPLYATLSTDSLIPVADYVQYRPQADELDEICSKISKLVDALRVAGVYDAANKGAMQNLLRPGGDNILVPIENWAAFSERGGLKGGIDFIPLDQVVLALQQLYAAREQTKQVIYEITGISDIIRGSSDPRETLGAQELKGQFGSKRLSSMQKDVVRFATDLLKIKAEMICKLYQPQTILMIAGAEQLSEQDKQLVPKALELLKSDPLSKFRIEVASDSLVEQDEQQDKQDRIEFITAISGFVQQSLQAPPELVPLLLEVMLFGIRGFKIGKSIEGAFDEAAEQLKQKAQQPPQPDPAAAQAQAEQQAEAARLQAEQERAQQQMMVDQQMELKKAELQQQTELKKAAMQSKTQIRTAAIAAGKADPGAKEESDTAEQLSQIMQAVQMLASQVQKISQEMTAPVEYERGQDGRVVSIKKGDRMMNVSYGPDGRMQGVS